MPTYETIRFEKDDGVAWVTLNRPEVRNAINKQMQDELRDLWRSLRYDDDELFGSELSPKLGLVWAATPSLALRASYGQGFRSPSFIELFFPFSGNPDLKPETSDSYEAEHDWTLAEGVALVERADLQFLFAASRWPWSGRCLQDRSTGSRHLPTQIAAACLQAPSV